MQLTHLTNVLTYTHADSLYVHIVYIPVEWYIKLFVVSCYHSFNMNNGLYILRDSTVAEFKINSIWTL